MKWKTLQHNGILFPPAYEAQGIKIKIKGETVNLNLAQEEMVYQWAKKKDTPYAQDKVFQKNFTTDFAKTLDSKFKKTSYDDMDFSNAYKIVVKDYLVEHDNMKGKSATEKLYHAKLANLEAAMMCNHKRTIPKTFEQSLQKKRDTLKKAGKDQAWKKTQETLKKVEASSPKTDTQKKSKTKRIKTLNEQIKKQKSKHKERLEKLELQIDLSEKTKDYNIGTSLRNYIDPRVFKAWTDEVGAEWEKLYTSALQKKFLWVKEEKVDWKKDFKN